MRKLGYIFTILTALLLFNITFTQFDRGYKASQNLLFKQEQLNGSMKTVTMSLSMERYQGSQSSFLGELIAFFQKYNYDGVINIQDRYTNNFYVYTDQSQVLNHLKLSDRIDDFNFKSQEEQRFISNNPLQKDATAYVLPFNRNENAPKSDSYNQEINYYPLHFLENRDNQSEHLIVGLQVFVQPEKMGTFKDAFYNDFLQPLIPCADVSDHAYCGMVISDDSREVEVLDQLMQLNAFTNPFEFPNSLLILTIGTLFTILVMINLEENREITIRHLHGNRPILIFKKIFLRPVLGYLAVFISTFIVMSVINIGFIHTISLRYLRNLGILTAIYFGFVMVTIILFFLFQTFTVKSMFLKRRTKSRIIQIVIPWFKIVAVVILAIPLVGIYDSYQNIRQYKHVVSKTPALQSGLMISSINYGYDTTSSESDAFNMKVFELVEHYGLSYINSDSMIDRHGDLGYIITNRNALNGESILTREGHVLDLWRLERNTMLVPEGSEDMPIPHFEVDTIPVRQTPNVASTTYQNTRNSIRRNVPILIVVTPDAQFVEWISTNSVFTSQSKETSFNHVVQEISKWSDMPEITRLEDVFETTMTMYKENQFKFYVMFGATLSLMVLFSSLIFEMFIDQKGMEVSVQYLQGKHHMERYGGVIVWNMMSVVVGYVIVIMYSTRMASEGSPKISIQSLTFLSFLVLLTDFIWMIYQIRKFENEHVLYFLKGDLG